MKLTQGKFANTLIEKTIAKHAETFSQLLSSVPEPEARELINSCIFLKMKEYFLKNNFESFALKIAPQDYYSWNLEQRAKFLNAPSTGYLCKTMVMSNRNFVEEKSKILIFK